MQLVEFLINKISICLIKRINFKEHKLCIRLEINRHSFFRKQIHDEIVVLSKIEENFRHRNNDFDDFRRVVNNNININNVFLTKCENKNR